MTNELPMPAPVATNWRSRAACRGGTDPDLFFPVAEDGALDERQVAEAKAVCAGCGVRHECLYDALDRIPYGIAGGMTPEERRLVARGRAGVAPITANELARDARTRAEVAAAGSALLAAGQSTGAVARACGVSERTVYRWRASRSSRFGGGRVGSCGYEVTPQE